MTTETSAVSSFTKKKRGRPRKYGPDVTGAASAPLASPHSSKVGGDNRKRRKTKNYSSDLSLGDQITSGGSFTPHMVTVNPGEDVTSKIISFSKHGPRAICVLSALGIISNVTLRQANSSVTYEGRFEILSLSGSFTPGEEFGEGGMSIALSSPDGRVVGGHLGGLLTAAAPVQVVVASFLPDARNPVGPKPRRQKNTTSTNMEEQNFHEQTQENPTPMLSVHDWRRTATDMNMNVSLMED
ncbi:hypothetical protein QVD17_13013 [Tagetes erecta]|uniref:AT-hook motif nuclear-localized protein n=1 Tax=Tagetes erecta TaxID=13708 RepID=A0AAD8KZL9_TARER|nr:hypothetical protein QVD17_13013 [Tagetes erecta]